MSTATPTRTAWRRVAVALVLIAFVLIVVIAVQQSLAAASAIDRSVPESGAETAPAGSVFAPSEADGVIIDGDEPTVFDVDRAAVKNLDPALLDALQRAATDAADDGVEFRLNSGWRSPELQQHTLDEAVDDYGSTEEAARWVATPETSAHVSGDAVDLGPWSGLDWLVQHGSRYGLCQIYGNEPWHYELRPDAVSEGCPPMYRDPTEDPRTGG
ncbi:M15 family metallopeptidase [Microbacterium sp.]|uniref:M15 family metallopeptidase n=1 Tax=Microbacterium sp. TaxID=51671 RepID=UPI00262E3750|nr:M15 family metallopeptidase [Microbacterium sp.]